MDVEEKNQRIQEIYGKFSIELAKLKDEQNKVIDDYIFQLEEKKKANLRKKLS